MQPNRNPLMYHRRGGALRPSMTVAAVMAAGALLTACGNGAHGPGVANVASTAASPNASADTGSSHASKSDPVAYSRCMRSHGIRDFPDPNANGQIQLSAGPGSDLVPDNPQFKAAQQACQSLMPAPSAAQQRKDLAGALKFARCMRAHGIQLPDPNGQTSASQSGPSTSSGSGGGAPPAFDPNSPQFKAAQQACQHYAPGGAGGFSLTASGKP
jgi:hypothetical protein